MRRCRRHTWLSHIRVLPSIPGALDLDPFQEQLQLAGRQLHLRGTRLRVTKMSLRSKLPRSQSLGQHPVPRSIEDQNLHPVSRLPQEHERITRTGIRLQFQCHQPRQGIEGLPHIDGRAVEEDASSESKRQHDATAATAARTALTNATGSHPAATAMRAGPITMTTPAASTRSAAIPVDSICTNPDATVFFVRSLSTRANHRRNVAGRIPTRRQKPAASAPPDRHHEEMSLIISGRRRRRAGKDDWD